jgi:ABC-type sulfate transport system permease subunit
MQKSPGELGKDQEAAAKTAGATSWQAMFTEFRG